MGAGVTPQRDCHHLLPPSPCAVGGGALAEPALQTRRACSSVPMAVAQVTPGPCAWRGASGLRSSVGAGRLPPVRRAQTPSGTGWRSSRAGRGAWTRGPAPLCLRPCTSPVLPPEGAVVQWKPPSPPCAACPAQASLGLGSRPCCPPVQPGGWGWGRGRAGAPAPCGPARWGPQGGWWVLCVPLVRGDLGLSL